MTPTWAIILVLSAVGIFGTIIAVFWWNLARNAAPYEDELDAAERRAEQSDGPEVVVIESGAVGRDPVRAPDAEAGRPPRGS